MRFTLSAISNYLKIAWTTIIEMDPWSYVTDWWKHEKLRLKAGRDKMDRRHHE